MNNQIYIGSTKDLRKRLKEHNNGKEISTKRYSPWKLVYYEAFIEEKLARIREQKLKHNGNAVRELKKRIGLLGLPSTTFNTKSNSSFKKMFQTKNNFVSKLNKSGAGFTLIELIVVIGILSILAAGSIVALNPVAQFQKANDSRRKSDLSQVQKTLEAYYQDNGKYPLSSTSTPLYRITVPPGSTIINWGQSWQPYMNLLPKDPTASKNYVYYSTGQSYYLYASLDRGSSDPGACNSGNACSSLTTNSISFNACGGTCNYGVSTPNVTP